MSRRSSSPGSTYRQAEAMSPALGEMSRQLGNVLQPLSQPRQQDREHGDAIPEVLAKRARCDHRGQVAMRGRDDPHVDVQSASGRPPVRHSRLAARGAAGPGPASGNSPISSRNSVPPSARSNQPWRVSDSPGETAPFVTEQLRVDQFGRNRAAVDANERPGRTRRTVVDRPRHHFLARPGLAQNQHRHIRTGRPIGPAP